MVRVFMFGLILGVAGAQAQPAQAPQEEAPGWAVRKVARAFRCDRKAIALTFLHREYSGRWAVTGWRVTGCGEPFMTATNRFRGITTVIHWDVPMRRRAPMDLTCDAEALTYTYVDYATRVAAGCGRQMTYVLEDNGQWVANVAVERPRQIGGIEGGHVPD